MISTNLKNGASLSALKPPERQVVRARISAAALEHAGFNHSDVDQFEVIQGLLRLQGVPERFLGENKAAAAGIENKTGDLVIEFMDA